MWEYNNQNELFHYGVKGMKWGVRHDRQRIGSRHRVTTSFSRDSQESTKSRGAGRSTKKKQSKIEAATASRVYKKSLRKDVKLAKKQGINYEVAFDKKGYVHSVQPYIGANKKISAKRLEEIESFIEKQERRKTIAAAGGTLIATGAAFASAYLR